MSELKFDPVDFDEKKQQGNGWISSSFKLVDGKKIPFDFSTKFEFDKWSTFTPKEITKNGKKTVIENDKRNYLTHNIYDVKPSNFANATLYGENFSDANIRNSTELGKIISDNCDAMKKSKKMILGDREDSYHVRDSLSIPDKHENNELILKDKAIKYKNFKSTLETKNVKYYLGKPLSEQNSKIVGKANGDIYKQTPDKEQAKKIVQEHVYTLYFENDNGTMDEKEIPSKDIVTKKIFTTCFKYREIKEDDLPKGSKKPNEIYYDEKGNEQPTEFVEAELNRIYGVAKTVKIETPSDLDEYITPETYKRYVLTQTHLWVDKSKGTKSDKEISQKYVCQVVEIIKIKKNFTGHKNDYSNYSFGQTVFNAPKTSSTNDTTKNTNTDKSDKSDVNKTDTKKSNDNKSDDSSDSDSDNSDNSDGSDDSDNSNDDSDDSDDSDDEKEKEKERKEKEEKERKEKEEKERKEQEEKEKEKEKKDKSEKKKGKNK